MRIVRHWSLAEEAYDLTFSAFARIGYATQGSRERQSLPRPMVPSIGDIFFP